MEEQDKLELQTKMTSSATAAAKDEKVDSSPTGTLTVALVSGLAAALLTLVGNYWITYKQVEKPKIELEQKKTLLEAHKQILSLAPKIESTCTAYPVNINLLRIVCSSKNIGVYPTIIKIDGVIIIIDSDISRNEHLPGKEYTVSYPRNKQQYLNPAGTPPGVLEAFLKFPEQKFPNGVDLNAIHINVQFKYETAKSATSQLSEVFPEQADLITDVSALPIESVPASISNSNQ